jgi:acetylornithine/succinyldiaminopimelate/putrescine aminotransferase
MQTARELTSRHRALLICDEIQAGLGRTGKYLASEWYGVKPDIVLLAKPLAGGLPLGAFLAREEFAGSLAAGMHGSTFGGGPLACRVALEFLAILKEEKILANVRAVGRYFESKLRALQRKHPMIQTVRGKGLMLAIDLDRPSRPFVEAALERGLIINSTHDTVLRFLPPLIIERKHVDQACDILDGIFAASVQAASASARA